MIRVRYRMRSEYCRISWSEWDALYNLWTRSEEINEILCSDIS